ncbi:hypothetical protein [Streptomyces aidingensis]|uniref:hypothetical protein n=1 Tax=Streptomyces aidingensis TaxID=910347 RepID=UPI001114B8A2|nr:hypothetical protein [Streptomyces aidingensis]
MGATQLPYKENLVQECEEVFPGTGERFWKLLSEVHGKFAGLSYESRSWVFGGPISIQPRPEIDEEDDGPFIDLFDSGSVDRPVGVYLSLTQRVFYGYESQGQFSYFPAYPSLFNFLASEALHAETDRWHSAQGGVVANHELLADVIESMPCIREASGVSDWWYGENNTRVYVRNPGAGLTNAGEWEWQKWTR